MRIKRYLKNWVQQAAPLLLVVLIAFAAVDAQAYTVTRQWARISATAGETLTEGQMVAIKAADGYAWKADADVSTARPAIGVIGKGGTVGTKVEIITSGILGGFSGLTKGAPAYLSETAGAITQSAPTWAQQVGVAISATEYLINPQVSGVVSTYRGYTLDTDNVTLTSSNCGEVHALATDAKTYTLPATVAGCMFTFINAGAGGHNIIELIPNAADQVFGETRIANGTRLTIAGAAGEHILNTKATAVRGDQMTIIGDGADGWYIVGSAGIWAEATP